MSKGLREMREAGRQAVARQKEIDALFKALGTALR